MRYLQLSEVLDLHRRVMEQFGDRSQLRDLAALESAIAQPQMTFGGLDLYPSREQKGGALCYSLVANHPFVDGNKRIGHACLEVFLILNGAELIASVDEAEELMLSLAAGELARDELVDWIRDHLKELSSENGSRS